MAQTQHTPREHNEPVPQGNGLDADTEAMLAAAVARKFTVNEGRVQLYNNGRYVELPTIPGFAGLGKAGPLVLQSVHQFIKNRIVKTGEGDVQELVNAAINDGVLPGANTDGPEDECFRDWIAERVEAKLGALPSDASKEAKEKRANQIDDTVTKFGSPENRAKAIAAARAFARSVPQGDKKKRTPKAVAATEAVDIAI